jgi:hypothetical protein
VSDNDNKKTENEPKQENLETSKEEETNQNSLNVNGSSEVPHNGTEEEGKEGNSSKKAGKRISTRDKIGLSLAALGGLALIAGAFVLGFIGGPIAIALMSFSAALFAVSSPLLLLAGGDAKSPPTRNTTQDKSLQQEQGRGQEITQVPGIELNKTSMNQSIQGLATENDNKALEVVAKTLKAREVEIKDLSSDLEYKMKPGIRNGEINLGNDKTIN